MLNMLLKKHIIADDLSRRSKTSSNDINHAVKQNINEFINF